MELMKKGSLWSSSPSPVKSGERNKLSLTDMKTSFLVIVKNFSFDEVPLDFRHELSQHFCISYKLYSLNTMVCNMHIGHIMLPSSTSSLNRLLLQCETMYFPPSPPSLRPEVRPLLVR